MQVKIDYVEDDDNGSGNGGGNDVVDVGSNPPASTATDGTVAVATGGALADVGATATPVVVPVMSVEADQANTSSSGGTSTGASTSTGAISRTGSSMGSPRVVSRSVHVPGALALLVVVDECCLNGPEGDVFAVLDGAETVVCSRSGSQCSPIPPNAPGLALVRVQGYRATVRVTISSKGTPLVTAESQSVGGGSEQGKEEEKEGGGVNNTTTGSSSVVNSSPGASAVTVVRKYSIRSVNVHCIRTLNSPTQRTLLEPLRNAPSTRSLASHPQPLPLSSPPSPSLTHTPPSHPFALSPLPPPSHPISPGLSPSFPLQRPSPPPTRASTNSSDACDKVLPPPPPSHTPTHPPTQPFPHPCQVLAHIY